MAPQGVPRVEGVEHSVEPFRALSAELQPVRRYGLPASQTSFVGRALELAELTQLLAAPACRLLTIIGPGGIGKTRLALEAAEAVGETFEEGAAFVSLQTVHEWESVAPALAVALGITLLGQGDVRDQVARYLRPAQMLLVLDNFEHLMSEAFWLSELLAEAPGLRILVTSREALNLREEWRYPLAGLGVPDWEGNDQQESEAVRLFVERARQVQQSFTFAPERDGVIQLCRITEGMPLALELAAAWITTLSCAAIAAEIEQNIAFLATGLRNIPARHRSMLAAFDSSWALLSEDERLVVQRLAVFRGGFSRAAAGQVAGATLPILSSLVNKSLARREADGRFNVHELLRQYAEERLRATTEEAARAYLAHRQFYLAFVAARFDAMTGGAQRMAIAEIAAELDNIRAAWRGAAAAGDAEALGRVGHTLTLFHDFRARYREGLALLEEGLPVLRAAAGSPAGDGMLAAMLVDTVRMNHRRARLSAMRDVLEEAELLYARLAVAPPPGQMTDPRVWRALLTLLDGQYAEAARLSATALDRNVADERPGNLPFAWWVRAAATLYQEDIDAASVYARQCSEAALAVGDLWHLAYGYILQGHAATARGDFAMAWHFYRASYELREYLDDHAGMGNVLCHMAKVTALQGDSLEAERLYRSSLAVARGVGDQLTTALALNGLGMAACATRDYATAGRHFAEGLRVAAEARLMRILLSLVASAGDWLLQTGRPVEAVHALALAQAHAASDRDTRARARQLLETVRLPPEAHAAALAHGRDTDPIAVTAGLEDLLTAPPEAIPTQPAQAIAIAPAAPSPAPSSPAAAGTLAEPLTARELAVLQLIAAGRSNREIADELFLSANTIRSYSHQLYGKLGVGTRTQAVARARELGLLS